MSIDSTLLAIAPELSVIPVERREVIENLAALSVGSVFCDKRELATAYLAAHMLTISGRSGNAGSVKSMKEGDLSITYADGADMKNSYSSTSYGLEFLRLRSETVFAARTRSV